MGKRHKTNKPLKLKKNRNKLVKQINNNNKVLANI